MSKVRLYLPKNRISNIIALEDKESLHKANDVLSLKKAKKFTFLTERARNTAIK
jgi:hypothetical protein